MNYLRVGKGDDSMDSIFYLAISVRVEPDSCRETLDGSSPIILHKAAD